MFTVLYGCVLKGELEVDSLLEARENAPTVAEQPEESTSFELSDSAAITASLKDDEDMPSLSEKTETEVVVKPIESAALPTLMPSESQEACLVTYPADGKELAPGQSEGCVTLVGYDGGMCTLNIWMPEEETLKRTLEAGIMLNTDFENEYSRILSNDCYKLNFNGRRTEGMGKLTAITVRTPLVNLEEGLKVGDSREDLLFMLGEPEFGDWESSDIDENGDGAYHYFRWGIDYYLDIGDSYILRVYVKDGVVTSWALCINLR
jgi:hypothetical protein